MSSIQRHYIRLEFNGIDRLCQASSRQGPVKQTARHASGECRWMPGASWGPDSGPHGSGVRNGAGAEGVGLRPSRGGRAPRSSALRGSPLLRPPGEVRRRLLRTTEPTGFA